MKVSDVLSHGEWNAKTSSELCQLFDLSPRDLRAAIHQERLSGEVILSSCSSDHPGYFLPSTDAEILRYVRQMESRIRQIWKATRSAKKALKASVQQQECNRER